MRKVMTKRSLAELPREHLLQKPYGFCCDEKDQDSERRYNVRKQSFASSLTDVALESGGPGLKFRVQDIARPLYPIKRRIEVKGATYLGFCRRCRGPLRWYLEDEVMFAREIIAKQKQINYIMNMKRNLKIAKQKARKRKNRIKRNLQKNILHPKLKIMQPVQ